MPQKHTTDKGAKAREAQLYLVYGDDEYRVATHARELVDRLCPAAEQALGLDLIEARAGNADEAIAAVRRCVAGLQTLGLLGGKKVVWLRDATFLSGAGENVRDVLDGLVEMIKRGLPPGQVLVVSATKVDGRSAFLKACQAAGDVREFALPEKTRQQEQYAHAWASQAFRQAGLKTSEEVVADLLEKTGLDTRQIALEVEKLQVYLGDRKDVRPADVAAVVPASREIMAWDLADAVGRRDLPGALKVLRQLMFQNENTIRLIAALENRYREILLYRQAMDRKWVSVTGREPWLKVEWKRGPEIDAVVAALPRDPRQVNPFRAGKLVEQARLHSTKELLRCQALVVRAHEEFLTASPSMKDVLPEILLIRLLGKKPAAEPRKAVSGAL